MEIKTRLNSLYNREDRQKEVREAANNSFREFCELGTALAKTKEGNRFFLLAKQIFYDQNELQRDVYQQENPLILARLNGEDYMLRNIVLKFLQRINGANEDSTK